MNKWSFYTTEQIKPEGWLKRQLKLQAEGLSGNLHKIWPDIRDSAWIGGKCDGWERVPYWLDGFIPLAYLLEDEEMIATAKKYIDAILEKQEADGWICPCPKDKRSGYDTWAVQLITKTLKVYYDCSADERIPEAIYKALRNYYDLLGNGEIALFEWGKHRWFEAFIALNFIYEKYGEEWIKDLAKILREQGFDYNMATRLWKTPRNRWRFDTHIVNLAMMLKWEAVSCDLLGQAYTDNAEKLRAILEKYNGTVYASFTGDECLSGISPVQGTELCAIVEQMYSYELLYAYTGDGKWAELLEILAFNALPAAISEDMWTHQYDQMSNQIACEKFGKRIPFRTNGSEAHLFGLEPNFGCCTANFNQGFPKLALSVFMHSGDTVINSVMLPSRLEADGISITLVTDYPFINKMNYMIKSEKDFKFIIRIPSFAENLTVNGEKVPAKDLEFDVKKGTTEITLEFETTPFLKARPNNLYAVQNGSLLFSLPVRYEKKMHEYVRDGVERKFPYCDYELVPTSDWNYAYSSENLTVKYNGVCDIPFSESKPPVTIKADMQKIGWGYRYGFKTVCAKVPKSLETLAEAEQLELIPYGCAKLRMTEMPLLASDEN